MIALLAIGIVVAAIYYIQQRNAPPPQPNVIYVNPNAAGRAAPAP